MEKNSVNLRIPDLDRKDSRAAAAIIQTSPAAAAMPPTYTYTEEYCIKREALDKDLLEHYPKSTKELCFRFGYATAVFSGDDEPSDINILEVWDGKERLERYWESDEYGNPNLLMAWIRSYCRKQ
jgi:hypothetical protein